MHAVLAIVFVVGTLLNQVEIFLSLIHLCICPRPSPFPHPVLRAWGIGRHPSCHLRATNPILWPQSPWPRRSASFGIWIWIWIRSWVMSSVKGYIRRACISESSSPAGLLTFPN
ncbi:hypothetical protein P170DRAFT_26186 [Aspergillus steynii IBT 23096]|uniref:Uncharacterized protein n=1 Tax=Aspergillus steynii IBT 23096 TaxID=1392250 RepID=A0A2I2GPN9_9EURO|nr:uncharacterized protein P170DRAFT_26186 [Aspergillus steynii IBT 23096]PLB54847.1 hypothetical protein P170DRAFT_26186 [Aspergillus steynii IBT 23096]